MTDHPRPEPAMPPVLGALILVLSGLGFPLTQIAIARFGRRGAGVVEAVRQAAVGALFGLHTYRFWIYLQPDRGLREAAGEPGGGSGSTREAR